MIDKPFYIIIAVYCASFGMLGAQFLADSYGITLTAPDGTVIKSSLIDSIKIQNINKMYNDVNNLKNGTSFIFDVLTTGSQIAFELFTLLTGTYIFNIMYLFGIPAIFIIPIAVVYVILLVRALIALVRGV